MCRLQWHQMDIIPDHCPISCINNLIDTVGRQQGKLFTMLDFIKGYQQIKMYLDFKSKTIIWICANIVVCHLD